MGMLSVEGQNNGKIPSGGIPDGLLQVGRANETPVQDQSGAVFK
jgi:hypothetical protein